MNGPAIFGVAGWKNSGKTTMVARLVAEFTARGRVVATVKHAHHAFDIDQQGTDSWQHRQAGAREVALVSRRRWAVMHELGDAPEPGLAEMIEKLSPCDMVIVEGFKREPHPKIELRRPQALAGKPLWPENSSIVALSSPEPVENCPLSVFHPEAIAAIADFIETHSGLRDIASENPGLGHG